MQSKIALMRAKRHQETQSLPQEGALLVELKSLKQKIAELQNTSHEFDLSFDEALIREALIRTGSRVGRLETKSAISAAGAVSDAAAEATLRNGTSTTP